LVVDDSVDAAESLAMLLAFDGHEIHKAHDGADLVRTAERVRPDVVLMDIGLPILDGCEAYGRIRGQAWGAEITMVAITRWGQEEEHEQSDAAGFDLHLVNRWTMTSC
jgi:CheY-like chemotaxis protein